MRLSRVLASASLLGVVVVYAFGNSPAAAYNAHRGPVTVTVTDDHSDARVHGLRVEARATAGVQIYEIRAHVCLPGRNVHTNFDFGFDGRACPNVGVGGGDVDPAAAFPNGTDVARLDGVRVGSGSAHWVNELGYPGSIRCDAGHSCDLVVRVQVTNDTVFVTVPLCGARPCPTGSSGSHGVVGSVWIAALVMAGVFAAVWVVGARRRVPEVRVS